MGLIIHSRPFKKVFVKRNPVLKQQAMFGFVKYIRRRNIKKKPIRSIHGNVKYQPTIHYQPMIHYQPRTLVNKFDYINLKGYGNIPKTILTNLAEYEKYTDFEIRPIPTEVLHDDEAISNLLNIYWFLHENGGIYLNKKIKIHPSIFIKNDFIGVNIDLFSCVKNSIVMKKIIDDAYIIIVDGGNMDELIQSFYKNIEGHTFNKSINFLI